MCRSIISGNTRVNLKRGEVLYSEDISQHSGLLSLVKPKAAGNTISKELLLAMTFLFLPPPPPAPPFIVLLFLPSLLPSHPRRPRSRPFFSFRSSSFSSCLLPSSFSSSATAASASRSLPLHFLSGGRGERCKVRHTATGPSEVQHPRDEAKTGQATRPN